MARQPVLEKAIMDILWDVDGWVTTGEVRERLGREVTLTTVGTVLGRLCRKGRVERRKKGRTYEYRAVRSREEHIATQMEELLDISRDRELALMRFVDRLPGTDRSRLLKLLRRREQ